jgi:excisionase family DNA binding protein
MEKEQKVADCVMPTTQWTCEVKRAHSEQPGPTVLTLREVAEYLRVHISTIYRLIERNELPAFKVGHGWRVNIEAVDELRFRSDSQGRRKK